MAQILEFTCHTCNNRFTLTTGCLRSQETLTQDVSDKRDIQRLLELFDELQNHTRACTGSVVLTKLGFAD